MYYVSWSNVLDDQMVRQTPLIWFKYSSRSPDSLGRDRTPDPLSSLVWIRGGRGPFVYLSIYVFIHYLKVSKFLVSSGDLSHSILTVHPGDGSSVGPSPCRGVTPVGPTPAVGPEKCLPPFIVKVFLPEVDT